MLRLCFFVLGLLLFANGCTNLKEVPANPKFDQKVESFFKGYWPLHKERASRVGLSQFDAVQDFHTPSDEKNRVAFYRQQLQDFSRFDEEGLSLSQRVDKRLFWTHTQRS